MANNHKKDTGEENIVEFISLAKDTQELINQAAAAREFAYCPYSKFKVGAAAKSVQGPIYSGCNVENSSYGLSICAERTALVKAISVGNKKFTSIAVVAELENKSSFIAPCGACRQFITEFGTEIVIYLAKPDLSKVLVTSAKELLPKSFHF